MRHKIKSSVAEGEIWMVPVKIIDIDEDEGYLEVRGILPDGSDDFDMGDFNLPIEMFPYTLEKKVIFDKYVSKKVSASGEPKKAAKKKAKK